MAALTPTHADALAPASRTAIQRLAARPWSADFYLAGSAALALYTGHRPVTDLDLMTNTNRLVSSERRDLLADLAAVDPATEVETARDGYFFVRLPGGVGVRFYYYPYPLVRPFEDFDALAVASGLDLGLMKLGAIISRGTRRDFVDLYLLCRHVSIEDLLSAAEDKFGHVRDFPLQALKGLADTSQVEGEPMPRLARPLSWDEVEAWVLAEVRRLGRDKVGLP